MTVYTNLENDYMVMKHTPFKQFKLGRKDIYCAQRSGRPRIQEIAY